MAGPVTPAPATEQLFLETLEVGPLGVNCYLVGDSQTGAGALIDPGEEPDRILAAARASGLTVEYILATHGHFDHVGAVAALKRKLGCPFLAHEGDHYFIADAAASAARWGFAVVQPPAPDGALAEGQRLALGVLELEVLHTPGHSPGGVVFYAEAQKLLFSGDTLFCRGIGRTDFRGGSFTDLAASIRDKLYTLPDETRVCPGHGPPTTIGQEKVGNPFVPERDRARVG